MHLVMRTWDSVSFLALLVMQQLLAADAPACTEHYPGQRRYQRYVVRPYMELPAGTVANDEVLIVRTATEWEGMKPPVLHPLLKEWRGKALIVLGPKDHSISCGRHG